MKNTILYRMIYIMCVLHEPMTITVHFTGMEIFSVLAAGLTVLAAGSF